MVEGDDMSGEAVGVLGVSAIVDLLDLGGMSTCRSSCNGNEAFPFSCSDAASLKILPWLAFMSLCEKGPPELHFRYRLVARFGVII